MAWAWRGWGRTAGRTEMAATFSTGGWTAQSIDDGGVVHLRDRRGTVRWRSLSQSFQHARARRRQAHTSLAPSWGAANKRTHISRRKTADSAATSLHTLLCRARQSRRGMHTRRGRPQPAGSQAHLCQARPTASHEHTARTVRQLRSRGPHPIKGGEDRRRRWTRGAALKAFERQTDRQTDFPPFFSAAVRDGLLSAATLATDIVAHLRTYAAPACHARATPPPAPRITA